MSVIIQVACADGTINFLNISQVMYPRLVSAESEATKMDSERANRWAHWLNSLAPNSASVLRATP